MYRWRHGHYYATTTSIFTPCVHEYKVCFLPPAELFGRLQGSLAEWRSIKASGSVGTDRSAMWCQA